jgi:hypothetical protein
MKSPHYSRINPVLFKQQPGEQMVRVIKAAQASKLLNGAANGHVHPPAEAQRKPEIRMIHSGADYCDLEVVCGCGESTQVRCWNTAREEKAAA